MRMALVDITGLRSTCSTPVGAESGVLLVVVVAVMLAPLADAILIGPERRRCTRRGRSAITPAGATGDAPACSAAVPQASGWRADRVEVILRNTGFHGERRPATSPTTRRRAGASALAEE